MSGRLQLIEKKLTAIDPAGFQNLCDVYLALREEEYSSLNRIGSQLGKQKTTTGTPDTFIRLKNNELAYIEYTTQADSKVSKIKDDISKCLDTSKTGVPKSELKKIIICFNSRLTTSEELKIQKFALTNQIKIELIGIDTLAIDILSKYFILSKMFLGMPLDTGQILPLEMFITEYDNKANQLATPLGNIFLNREQELHQISEDLSSEDLIIIYGKTGVGKSKFALESISLFLSENKSFTAYAISNKDANIFEDIKIYLHPEKDYIILIDDVNRQTFNLKQLLGAFKEVRKGKIKIVLTVRDYAVSDILKIIAKLKYQKIELLNFTDKELINILESESFKITNRHYQDRIINIADGNARLAIMAAKLALDKEVQFLFESAFEIFEAYFERSFNDTKIFDNEILLKTLAVVSFFFSINREDKAFMDKLLKSFHFDYYSFNEAIEILHNNELVDIQSGHVRISEQIMGQYVFYKVFIENSILSFEDLLFNYFEEEKHRFRECLIPINNLYGDDKISPHIDKALESYLSTIKTENEKFINCLDLFWFYKRDLTLHFFYQRIYDIEEPVFPIYLTEYGMNDFVYEKEQTLYFLSRFFDHNIEHLPSAIELGFEYIRKKPEHLPEFIRCIKEHLIFKEEDELNGFNRQLIFTNTLLKNVAERKPHYLSAFFALTNFFLQHKFQITSGGRNNSFQMYQYPFPLTEETNQLRANIWNSLFNCFEEYPNEVTEIIANVIKPNSDLNADVADYDLSFLISFIDNSFSPSNFKQTYLIHELIYWYDKQDEITNRTYRLLKERFHTDDFKDYKLLSSNKIRDKKKFEFKDNQEYQELKKSILKKSFSIENEKQFPRLINAILNTRLVQENNYFSAAQSIDYIITNAFINNNEIGFKLFFETIKYIPKGVSFYHSIYCIINSSEEWCNKFWQKIKTMDNSIAQPWKLYFFNCIPDNYINKYHCQELLSTIRKINNGSNLSIGNLERYKNIEPYIIKSILEIIAKRNTEEKAVISFPDYIFEEQLGFFEEDYDLIKSSYFQQYEISNDSLFDYDGIGLRNIFDQHPQFIMDFIEEFHNKRNLNRKNRAISISFLWSDKANLDLIEKIYDFLVGDPRYYFMNANEILFHDIKDSDKENAYGFLESYLRKHIENPRKVNTIIKLVRNHLNNQFDKFILLYLGLNSNLKDFKSLDWISRTTSIIGNGSHGNMRAARWENILTAVNKSPDTLKMIPIKAYIKEKISSEYRFAEHERKREFVRPEY